MQELITFLAKVIDIVEIPVIVWLMYRVAEMQKFVKNSIEDAYTHKIKMENMENQIERLFASKTQYIRREDYAYDLERLLKFMGKDPKKFDKEALNDNDKT
jgi:hypothetical protein